MDMQDELSESQLQQLIQNDILSEWLGECGFTAKNLVAIDEALAILASKRTTLEEKIIRKELHTLVSNYCAILSHVHVALSAERQPPVEALERLRSLNFRVHAAIDSLLKALKYDLNYVEQYFEFDFCARLCNEYRFNEEAQETLKLFNEADR